MPVVSGYQTAAAGSGTDNDTLVVTRTGSIAYTGDVAVFMSGDNQRTTIYGEVFSSAGRAVISQGANSSVYVAEGGNVSGTTGVQTGTNALVQNAGTIQASGGNAIYMSGRLENAGLVMGSVVMSGQYATAVNTGEIMGLFQAASSSGTDSYFSVENIGFMKDVDSRAANTTFDNSGTIGDFYAQDRLTLHNSGTIGSLRFDDGAGYVVNNGYIGGSAAYFSTLNDYYDGRGGVITATVYGGEGDDTIMGGDQSDSFSGGLGADKLFGYGGDDVLQGGDTDRLAGGTGDDLYIIDIRTTGSAKVVERADGGMDTVRSFTNYTLGANVESLELLGENNAAGTGNALDNLLTGDITNNRLVGLGGSDEIHGGKGNDTLIGGTGMDELYGDEDLDTFVFLSGDTAKIKAGADTIHGFSTADGDRIDLSQFDANIAQKGIQQFDFIGSKAFSKTAGELRFEKDAADTWIYGDVNGDRKADFVIHLDASVDLKGADFLL